MLLKHTHDKRHNFRVRKSRVTCNVDHCALRSNEGKARMLWTPERFMYICSKFTKNYGACRVAKQDLIVLIDE
jgi:hypothetical protein